MCALSLSATGYYQPRIADSIVSRLRAGRSRFEYWQRQETSLFSKTSRQAVRPTQFPFTRVPVCKRYRCEDDYWPHCNDEVKNGGDIRVRPCTISRHEQE
jgi:hypothetical protein